jgi:hypothetical protein
MTHIFDIHRLLLSIIILIGCYHLKFGKSENLYQELYSKGETSTDRNNKSGYWPSIKFFISNIDYS